MKIYISAPIIAVALTLSACTSEYKPSQIKIISEGFHDDGVKLSFSVTPESMYYCPGANLKKIDSSKIQLMLIRAKIDSKPKVDIEAIQENGHQSILIPFPGGQFKPGDSIELIDAEGKTLGKWSRKP